MNFCQIEAFEAALSVCDIDGDGFATFELSNADEKVLNGQVGMAVSYFVTMSDAEDDENPLSETYTNISNPQTIYSRIDDGNGCFAVSAVTLASYHDGVRPLSSMIVQAPFDDPNPFPTGYYGGGYYYQFPPDQGITYHYGFSFDHQFIPVGFEIDPAWAGSGMMSITKLDDNPASASWHSVETRITEYNNFAPGAVANGSGDTYHVYGRGHFTFNGVDGGSAPRRSLTFDFSGLANGFLPAGTLISVSDIDGANGPGNNEFLLAEAVLVSGEPDPWMTALDSTVNMTIHGHAVYEAPGQPENSYFFNGPSVFNASIAYVTTQPLYAITITSENHNNGGSAGLRVMAPIVPIPSNTCPVAGIGDVVYLDITSNGQQDTSELGLPNIEVELFSDPDGDGDPADGISLATTLTDSNGGYLFENLTDGNYVVSLKNTPVWMINTGDPDGGNDKKSALTISGGAYNLDQDFGIRLSADRKADRYDIADPNQVHSASPPWGDFPERSVSEEAIFRLDDHASGFPDLRVASLYPNPSLTGMDFHLTLYSEILSDGEITLTDSGARVVKALPATVLPGENHITIQSDGLPAGTYYVRYRSSRLITHPVLLILMD